ncbi:DNA helicase [Tanacetum coccineum]
MLLRKEHEELLRQLGADSQIELHVAVGNIAVPLTMDVNMFVIPRADYVAWLLKSVTNGILSYLNLLTYSKMLNAGSTPVYDDLGDCDQLNTKELNTTYVVEAKMVDSVSANSPSYMSLQLNLLFIYGQSGFHTKLKLPGFWSADSSGIDKGGTCYMYAHYLDTLAICRKLGNPQFFITFTCNVNWPEIKRYMAQFLKLTTSDKADVVCQVFEQKIKLFIAFLKKERTFGDVARFLYTVKFQKHGRPHCHTLLWVDSTSKIQSPEDVDRFILAKLPDPNVDPHGYKIVLEMMIHGPCRAANLSAPYGSYAYKIPLHSISQRLYGHIFARISRPLGELSNATGPSRPPIDEIQNYLKDTVITKAGVKLLLHQAYFSCSWDTLGISTLKASAADT